jgi:hypothetical protein
MQLFEFKFFIEMSDEPSNPLSSMQPADSAKTSILEEEKKAD